MASVKPQLEKTIPELDLALANRDLLNAPRAVLLLRVCQFAQVFRQDIFDAYWKSLCDLSGSLPADHRAAFEAMRQGSAPVESRNSSKFTQQVFGEVDKALAQASVDPAEAGRILESCVKTLDERWWPWGKRAAWIALVRAWADVDRARTLQLLNKIPAAAGKSILARVNERSPLTADEWDTAYDSAGKKQVVIPLVLELLDKQDAPLHLSMQVAVKAGVRLGLDMQHQTLAVNGDRESQREKHLAAYLELANRSLNESPKIAQMLMERLFLQMTGQPFCGKWFDDFTLLRRVINHWASYKPLRQEAGAFIAARSPAHLRDFALAHWHGMTAADKDEAAGALQSLLATCSDKPSSEAWFLVTLMRLGLCEEAMQLAEASAQAGQLLPRLRRAWLAEHPESAATRIRPEDLKEDLIGQFLLLGTSESRSEFLRRQTNNGAASLPKEMWSRPSPFSFGPTVNPNHANPCWYSIKEAVGGQFREYLRLCGYGQYNFEDVDAPLLGAMVVWEEEHPQEVRSLIERMWSVVQLDHSALTFDLMRNAVFERCQNLFCVQPKSLDEVFIRWVREKLVVGQASRYEGQTAYTLSLKNSALFLYSLLSAQRIAVLSPRRCDEILETALNQYEATADLITAAGKIYAADRGLDALAKELPARQRNLFLKEWQIGIIQASTRNILSLVLAEQQEASQVAAS